MTQVVRNTSQTSPKGLAGILNRQSQAIAALNVSQTTYVLDSSGNCVFVFGPDISSVPVNSFSDSPSMVSTGLSGAGAASKSTGSWVKL